MALTYTINDPRTGDAEDFKTLAEAKREARKKDYTPVFIDFYDEEDHDIVTDLRVDNPGKELIP